MRCWGRQGQGGRFEDSAHRGVVEGHLEVVRFLCEAGADKDKVVGESTPLITASRGGHLDVVRFLCDAGADKDKEEDSNNPLIEAWWRGYLEGILFLLEARREDDDARPRQRRRVA